MVVDSSNREEEESGCAAVVRILEAIKEGEMEWRLQRVEEGYEELLTDRKCSEDVSERKSGTL